jgi:hypothetical protein
MLTHRRGNPAIARGRKLFQADEADGEACWFPACAGVVDVSLWLAP